MQQKILFAFCANNPSPKLLKLQIRWRGSSSSSCLLSLLSEHGRLDLHSPLILAAYFKEDRNFSPASLKVSQTRIAITRPVGGQEVNEQSTYFQVTGNNQDAKLFLP
jgi:hypothetical protein